MPLTNVFIESLIPENASSGKIFEVRLRINKGVYKGPGKIVQKYPEGFTALVSQGGYANFTFSNQNAIIEWDQMPADSVINYSYQVRVGESVAGSQAVSGRFEYQQPDGLKINRFNNYIFVDNKLEDQMDQRVREILGEGTTSTTQREELKTDTKSNLNVRIDQLLSDYGNEDAIKLTERLNDPVNVQPFTAAQGIEYRIQVGAFRDRSQGGNRLANRFNIRETMTEETANGWYKFTIGNYRTYQEAVKARDSFIQRTKLWSAFIVAYRDGKRLASVANVNR